MDNNIIQLTKIFTTLNKFQLHLCCEIKYIDMELKHYNVNTLQWCSKLITLHFNEVLHHLQNKRKSKVLICRGFRFSNYQINMDRQKERNRNVIQMHVIKPNFI